MIENKKKAFLLCVGDEVLSGKTINTNASFLSKTLGKIGIDVAKISTVGDSELAIENEVKDFLNSDFDYLVTTGGLGPTHDDFTKEVVFKTLGIELVLRDEGVDLLNKYFPSGYTHCNIKQAYFPKDALLLNNDCGTSMGCLYNYQNKTVIVLVGPPSELIPMVNNYLVPIINKDNSNNKLFKEYLLMGTCESEVEELLKDYYKKYNNVTINPYFSIGKIRFEITALSSDLNDFNNAINDFENILSDYIVSYNGDAKIEDLVLEELKRLNYHISFSESCTGGMMASLFINTSGASNAIDESFVCYSNESKIKLLGVKKETIEKYDVVSSEVVAEMVKGLNKLTNANVCVATSGYAGPTGGTKEIPVGTVWVGIFINGKIITKKYYYKTSRNILRERVTMNTFYDIYKLIKNIN